jgi:hypothetical protein
MATMATTSRPPVPPFTGETAIQRVRWLKTAGTVAIPGGRAGLARTTLYALLGGGMSDYTSQDRRRFLGAAATSLPPATHQ